MYCYNMASQSCTVHTIIIERLDKHGSAFFDQLSPNLCIFLESGLICVTVDTCLLLWIIAQELHKSQMVEKGTAY